MKTWMCALMLALSTGASAQNPIISGQYSADPTARVFNGKVYLYPSHDIPSPIEKLKEWFCMADYHVFSSDNLTFVKCNCLDKPLPSSSFISCITFS